MALAYGAYARNITTAFLQDADSLVLPTPDLLEILDHLEGQVPRPHPGNQLCAREYDETQNGRRVQAA